LVLNACTFVAAAMGWADISSPGGQSILDWSNVAALPNLMQPGPRSWRR
jgi:hypothetical protein